MLKLSVVSYSYGFENRLVCGQPKIHFGSFMIYLLTLNFRISRHDLHFD